MPHQISRFAARLPIVGVLARAHISRRVDREYASELAEAKKRGDHEAYQRIREERDFEQRMSSDEDDIAFTKELVRTANHLRVPQPTHPPWNERDSENEYWSYSSILGQRYLTPLGVSVLRDAIRKERDARRAERSHAIAWIGAITGLVGALTGLAAVWSK